MFSPKINQWFRHTVSSIDDSNQSIGIVSHSFGDWIARRAIALANANDGANASASADAGAVQKLVSICPVTVSVAIARLLRRPSGHHS